MCDSCAKVSCKEVKRLNCTCACGRLVENHIRGIVYYKCMKCGHEICSLLYVHANDEQG